MLCSAHCLSCDKTRPTRLVRQSAVPVSPFRPCNAMISCLNSTRTTVPPLALASREAWTLGTFRFDLERSPVGVGGFASFEGTGGRSKSSVRVLDLESIKPNPPG